MTEHELLSRIKVGRKPLLVDTRPFAALPGWYRVAEIAGPRDLEVRYHPCESEEGAVAFFGTYESTAAMVAALVDYLGCVESWQVDESPIWRTVDEAMTEAMRGAIRTRTLPLPDGVEPLRDDEYWAPADAGS